MNHFQTTKLNSQKELVYKFQSHFHIIIVRIISLFYTIQCHKYGGPLSSTTEVKSGAEGVEDFPPSFNASIMFYVFISV